MHSTHTFIFTYIHYMHSYYAAIVASSRRCCEVFQYMSRLMNVHIHWDVHDPHSIYHRPFDSKVCFTCTYICTYLYVCIYMYVYMFVFVQFYEIVFILMASILNCLLR